MDKIYANGLLSKSGLENPSKSEVIIRCGGDEKKRKKSRKLKNNNFI